MNISELRQMTPKKLFKTLREQRRQLAVTRFHVATGQNTDTAIIKKMRKTIARIVTLLNTPQK